MSLRAEDNVLDTPAFARPGRIHAPSATLRALEDEQLSDRFRSWKGASGRAYIFSVFEARSCPAYCQAVLIAVAVEPNGRRTALGFAETGSFPEPSLSELRRTYTTSGRRLEFHVHLLAGGAEERREVIRDLSV